MAAWLVALTTLSAAHAQPSTPALPQAGQALSPRLALNSGKSPDQLINELVARGFSKPSADLLVHGVMKTAAELGPEKAVTVQFLHFTPHPSVPDAPKAKLRAVLEAVSTGFGSLADLPGIPFSQIIGHEVITADNLESVFKNAFDHTPASEQDAKSINNGDAKKAEWAIDLNKRLGARWPKRVSEFSPQRRAETARLLSELMPRLVHSRPATVTQLLVQATSVLVEKVKPEEGASPAIQIAYINHELNKSDNFRRIMLLTWGNAVSDGGLAKVIEEGSSTHLLPTEEAVNQWISTLAYKPAGLPNPNDTITAAIARIQENQKEAKRSAQLVAEANKAEQEANKAVQKANKAEQEAIEATIRAELSGQQLAVAKAQADSAKAREDSAKAREDSVREETRLATLRAERAAICAKLGNEILALVSAYPSAPSAKERTRVRAEIELKVKEILSPELRPGLHEKLLTAVLVTAKNFNIPVN